MARKRATAAPAPAPVAASSTHWTTEETSRLIEYLTIHRAEGGDGINFKQVTFTGAVAHLLEPPDGVAKETYVANHRDWQSCKNKWNMCKKKYVAIMDIKSQSGFSWDDDLGANIGPADAARWTAFSKTRPDTKPFRNKGWMHFDEMSGLMHAQPSRGTNAFHAGQQTFESEQAPHDDLDETSGGQTAAESESVDATVRDGGLPTLEQVVGVSGNDEGEPLVVEPQADDDDEDDIIPWEATPPPHVPAKRKLIAASLTPSLTASGSTGSSSRPSSKRQCVSGPSAALYAINDQFSEFTDIFRTASQSQSQTSSIVLSPQRKQAAMRRAQELEKHLDDDSMAALIEAFQMDVSAADAYMVMCDDGPRRSFVDRKIKHINRQVL